MKDKYWLKHNLSNLKILYSSQTKECLENQSIFTTNWNLKAK